MKIEIGTGLGALMIAPPFGLEVGNAFWTLRHYRDLLRPEYATQQRGLWPQIGGKCC